MQKSPPPSRAEKALDTSPPLRGVEDEPSQSQAPILHPAKRGGGAEPGDEVTVGEAEGGIDSKPSRSRRRAGTTERARKLRWVENSAEGALWSELKGRKLGGYHFTRQFPIGPYFADFCCRKQKLVVEIDGSQHADSADDRRDEFMRSRGFATLRFWNHDVLKHRTAVCDTILAALDGRLAENVSALDLRFIYAGGAGKTPTAGRGAGRQRKRGETGMRQAAMPHVPMDLA
ncbi:MAG: endonuclease domain-containing protein [Rhizobiaceae bacterium]|nr:endonuclease domain-containing protein [Rhizobiaceae bacterium]